MRTAFFKTIMELAAQDPKVFLVVGDLGFGVVEPFAEKFPNQFLNCGVAEQNMTGIAAGLALEGKKVFTYSIANFPTLRCLEQIRNDACYHNANVKVVAVGGGFAYGSLGMTHHATEDLAILRVLPNMVVVAPGDPQEAAAATRAVAEHQGPCYLRLGRAGEKSVHLGTIQFQLGKAIKVLEGTDVTLISTGGMLETATAAAELLNGRQIRARVLSMHTIKPLDEQAIMEAARETGAVVTVEEHSKLGGLGGAVAEVLAERDDIRVPFRRIGLPSEFSSLVGTQEFLREAFSLTASHVADTAEQLLTRSATTARSGA